MLKILISVTVVVLGSFLITFFLMLVMDFGYVERNVCNISMLFQLLEEFSKRTLKYPSNTEWWKRLREKIMTNEERSKVVLY